MRPQADMSQMQYAVCTLVLLGPLPKSIEVDIERLRRIEAALAKGQTPLSRAEAKALHQRVEPMVWQRLLHGTQWRAGSDAEGLPKVLMRRSLPET